MEVQVPVFSLKGISFGQDFIKNADLNLTKHRSCRLIYRKLLVKAKKVSQTEFAKFSELV